jgi:hypothetical protein
MFTVVNQQNRSETANRSRLNALSVFTTVNLLGVFAPTLQGILCVSFPQAQSAVCRCIQKHR